MLEPTIDHKLFTQADVEQNICSRFNQIVACYPDRIAIDDGTDQFSYRELDLAANRLAIKLLPLLEDDCPWVPLLVGNSSSIAIGILAILKAGKGWIALDPNLPSSRLTQIIEDSGSATILYEEPLFTQLEEISSNAHNQASPLELKPLKITTELLETGQDTNAPKPEEKSDSLACLLYTSGSTGGPKGVVHSHENLLHVVRKSTNTLLITPEDHIGMISPLGHVVGAVAMLISLLNGAKLLPFNVAKRGFHELAQWLSEYEISYFHTVPTVFRRIARSMDQQEITLNNLRILAIGGEAVSSGDIETFSSHFKPGTILRNSYGSTEAIDTFQHFLVGDDIPSGTTMPIGQPCSDSETLALLDEEGLPVEPGLPGEIFISSPYLALGYWEKPEQTQASFVCRNQEPNLWYRTGDQGYLDHQGLLVSLGRLDTQIKINGFRVELAEVEAALLSLPQIKECAVDIFKGASTQNQLIAYLVFVKGKEISAVDIRKQLLTLLPEYMIPVEFATLDRLPQTNSGKLDRRALPRPNSTSENYRYQLQWLKLDAPKSQKQLSSRDYILLVGPHSTKTDAFIEVLEQNNRAFTFVSYGEALAKHRNSDFSIEIDQPQTIQRTFEQIVNSFGSPRYIVHIPYCIDDDSQQDISMNVHSNQLNCQLLLRLVQTKVKHSPREKTRLILATYDTHYYLGQTSKVSPQHATLWGLGRSIPREHPEIDCRLIDLESSSHNYGAQELFQETVAEDESDDQVLYRSGERYVARFRGMDIQQTESNPKIDSNASYLITGGLGELGLCYGEKLAQRGARHIILSGRSGASLDALKRIDRLKSQGANVHVVSSDITNNKSVQNLLLKIENEMPPLKGIFHAAGTYDFSVIAKTDWPNFKQVMEPKVAGAWFLHQNSLKYSLDYFVMTSSITSTLGFTGHADYCAANSYLNGLAYYRQSIGLPALSLNLGTISGGMANSAAIQKWLESEGIGTLTPDEALNHITELVPQRQGYVALLKADWGKVAHTRKRSKGSRELFSYIDDSATKSHPKQTQPKITASKKSLAELELRISELWKTILSKKSIDKDDNFFDIGGDSLALVEMHLSLLENIDVEISVAEIFDNPTISGLATLIKGDEKSDTNHRALLPIRSGNDRPPLFVINSTGPSMRLANHLDQSQGVHNLNMFRVSAEFKDRLNDHKISEIAQLFAEDIMMFAPNGPYRLLGFCQDGLLAVETAQALQKAGHEIDSLCLVDVIFGGDIPIDLAMRYRALRELGPQYLIHTITRKFKSIKKALKYRSSSRINSKTSSDDIFYSSYLKEALTRTPEPYHGEINLFITSEWRLKDIQGTQNITKTAIRVHPVIGTHRQVFEPPYINGTATEISKILNRRD